MTRLGSEGLPPEIWLKVASYMDMVDIRKAETVNRTFAALVAEDQKDQCSRLILNTYLADNVPSGQISAGDWKITAYNIMKRLQSCIKADRAAHIKRIVFYSPAKSLVAPSRSKFDEFNISLKGTANQLLLAQRLRSIYKQFGNVESLSLLHNDAKSWRGPRCMDYLEPKMLWSTWGTNLRELNISDTGAHTLFWMLPPESCKIELPRLEVMRVAYRRYLRPDDDGQCPALNIIAQLYAPATATLVTLDLRFHEYGPKTSPIAAIFLPPGVVFSKLRHFVFRFKRHSPDVIPGEDFGNVTRFIRDHSDTLRKFEFTDLPTVLDSLVKDPLPSLLNDTEGAHPPIALSICAPRDSQILDPTVNDGTTVALRERIIVLGIHISHNSDWSRLLLLGNLRKLALTCSLEFSPRIFVELALNVPRIVSLSIQHCATDATLLRDWLIFLWPNDENILKQWRLKDVGIYRCKSPLWLPSGPSWRYMQKLAAVIPSIESYFGRGHIEENLGQQWEESWEWRVNKYVDQAMGC